MYPWASLKRKPETACQSISSPLLLGITYTFSPGRRTSAAAEVEKKGGTYTGPACCGGYGNSERSAAATTNQRIHAERPGAFESQSAAMIPIARAEYRANRAGTAAAI